MKTPRPARAAQAEDSVEAAQQFWATLDERFLGRIEVLRAQLAKSNLGVALQGALARQVRTGAGNGTRVATSPGRLVGYSLRETAGAALTVYLRDGADNTGDVIAVVHLAANDSRTESLNAPSGVSFGDRGLYVDPGAGAIEGAVFLGATD